MTATARLRSALGRARRMATRRRRRRAAPTPTPLQEALIDLLSARGILSIVQVGANDGRINDPINGFVSSHRDTTRLLLIEPQVQLLPMLRQTYADHPCARIEHCAIGPSGEMTLWQVAEQFWDDVDANYSSAGDWPSYRAPSGVTSSSREHVVAWLSKHYVIERPLDELITSFTIPSLSLFEVLESSGFGLGVDLLQVDTEGSDDVVIMNSSIESIRPALINFEWAHLTDERYAALDDHLRSNGYTVTRHGPDALAVLRAR